MAFGDQLLSKDGKKLYQVLGTKDLSNSDILAIDATADVVYEWSETMHGYKPGIMHIATNTATFIADALAHANVSKATAMIDDTPDLVPADEAWTNDQFRAHFDPFTTPNRVDLKG